MCDVCFIVEGKFCTRSDRLGGRDPLIDHSVPRRMLHRQWWPSCQPVGSRLDTEADTALQSFPADTSSTVDPKSSAVSYTPPEDDSVTWQELLVQKLLPKHSMSASQQTLATSHQASPVSSGTMSVLSSGKHDPRAAPSQGWQYAGIFLDPLSTARLLAWAPPRHSRLHGDHMSLLVKPSPEQLSSLDLGCEVTLSVLARTENAAIQVVAVQCPPWASQLLQRPAHITISTAEGVKANSAGDLLRKVEKGHIYGVQTSPCTDTFNLTGRVGVKLLNGSVAYSVAELSSAPNTDKCSDSKLDKCANLEPVSALHGHQSELFSCSRPSQQHGIHFPTPLPVCMPTAGLTSPWPTPSGPLQAHPSLQAYTADTGLSKAGTAAAPLSRPQPLVQHVPTADLSDDDAFDAICDLDALLTPASLPQAASHSSRDSAEQHRRHPKPSSVHLYTSTAHSGSPQQHQYSQSQSSSPKKADVRAQVYSPKKADVRPQLYSPNKGDGRCSANFRGSGRCLWTGDQQAAAEASLLPAPMTILKRSVIPDQQASCSAVSHPSAATASVPTASLSRPSGAAAGSLTSPCSTVGTVGHPVSAISSNQSPLSESGLNHLQRQQSMQGSKTQRAVHSHDGSASKAPSVAALSSSAELASAVRTAACCTDLPASTPSTACAFPPGFRPNTSPARAFPPGLQPRQTDHRHHVDLVQQLVVELQEQPVLAKASGLEPAGQVAQDETDQANDLSQQHRPSHESSQAATGFAATSMSRQQTGSHTTQSTVAPKQLPLIDVACSSAAEQVTTRSNSSPDDSSVSIPGSSQPVLLPAGTTSALPSQLNNEAAAARSPSAHASVEALTPAPSLQQTTNAGALRSDADSLDLSRTERPGVVLPHQLDFLMTDDPVATALVEANKVVADRAGLMSLADQRREALNLHVQAKDTYFAAAQTAHEKGDRDAALQLTAKGKEHAQLAKEARQAANQAAFESFNLHVTNRFKVDLHGLHVEEALQVLEQHLLTLGGLGCPGGVLLQIITGVGKHSINGRPKILPAVVRYLSDAGYRFTETLGNSGVLEVNIGGHRRLLDG